MDQQKLALEVGKLSVGVDAFAKQSVQLEKDVKKGGPGSGRYPAGSGKEPQHGAKGAKDRLSQLNKFPKESVRRAGNASMYAKNATANASSQTGGKLENIAAHREAAVANRNAASEHTNAASKLAAAGYHSSAEEHSQIASDHQIQAIYHERKGG